MIAKSPPVLATTTTEERCVTGHPCLRHSFISNICRHAAGVAIESDVDTIYAIVRRLQLTGPRKPVTSIVLPGEKEATSSRRVLARGRRSFGVVRPDKS